MKRDMDLVRDILLAIEANESPSFQVEALQEKYDQVALHYHVGILHEAGYLSGRERHSKGTGDWQYAALTWEGHEFLNTIRDPEIWRKSKDTAGKVGTASAAFLFDIAKAYAKVKAKELLGTDLG